MLQPGEASKGTTIIDVDLYEQLDGSAYSPDIRIHGASLMLYIDRIDRRLAAGMPLPEDELARAGLERDLEALKRDIGENGLSEATQLFALLKEGDVDRPLPVEEVEVRLH